MKKLSVLMFCAVLFDSAGASAQSASFAWIVDRNAGADMPLLTGWAATARLGTEPIIFRYERQDGSMVRMRSACVGLVPPDADCTPQLARVSLRSRGGSIGYAFALAGSERVRYSAQPALGVMRLNGEATLLRGTIELATSIQLVSGVPLSAVVGTRVSLAASAPDSCVDCAPPSWADGYAGVGLSASVVLGLR
jgi:hypothetical protein